jgi:molybdate transport system ATP-binding protein
MPETALTVDARVRLDAFALEVALSVRSGETLVVVGPSGAGKSTLLALIAGLVRPDSGTVVCGVEAWSDANRSLHRPPEARRVGLVLQDFALFPHRDVAGNVRYGPESRGHADPAAAAQLWSQRLGLAGLERRTVSSLSGGERQRVALARALASDPQVLLLDEPFSALDLVTRSSVRARLKALLAEWGLPTILVSHDPIDALAFGDRIAVLEAGRVTQLGSAAALTTQPRTGFVAELLGLNLYRAQVATGSGLKQAHAGAVEFHVLADDLAGPCFLAFAPSEVSLAPVRGPGSPQNVFEGRIRELLPLQDRTRVVLDVGVLLMADVTREAASGLALAPGRTIFAQVKATAIRVYG